VTTILYLSNAYASPLANESISSLFVSISIFGIAAVKMSQQEENQNGRGGHDRRQSAEKRCTIADCNAA
jgi:hypothetical protein